MEALAREPDLLGTFAQLVFVAVIPQQVGHRGRRQHGDHEARALDRSRPSAPRCSRRATSPSCRAARVAREDPGDRGAQLRGGLDEGLVGADQIRRRVQLAAHARLARRAPAVEGREVEVHVEPELVKQ